MSSPTHEPASNNPQPAATGSGSGVSLILPIVGLALAIIFGSSIYVAKKVVAARNAKLSPVAAPQGGPTEAMFNLPPFSLTERSGKPVTLDTLKGNVWIVDFIFTSCAGPCPMMTHRMANLQSQLAGDRDIRLLTITVDPKTDTPERLTQYAKQYRAQPEKWYFLTGPRDKIFDLSTKGFKLAAIVDDETQTHADHPILHSTKFVLVDRQGRIRAYYDGNSEDDLARLQTDARHLAAERAG